MRLGRCSHQKNLRHLIHFRSIQNNPRFAGSAEAAIIILENDRGWIGESAFFENAVPTSGIVSEDSKSGQKTYYTERPYCLSTALDELPLFPGVFHQANNGEHASSHHQADEEKS